MKIFSAEQVREIDRYTIENEPVPSVDLMERAAGQLFHWVEKHYPPEKNIVIFAGPGNNGGDALALARLLAGAGFKPEVYLLMLSGRLSPDCAHNLERLKDQGAVPLSIMKEEDPMPDLAGDLVLVDGLFGSGLTRPLEGRVAALVEHINNSGKPVVSIDIPSGLFADRVPGKPGNPVIRASHTLSFQFPKLSFLLPESQDYVGEWEVLPIGLHPGKIAETFTPWNLFTRQQACEMLKSRKKFAHKGHFGHALLIAGCFGKMGAAVMGARACLRAGAGLLTVHVPRYGCEIIQTAVPEAMVSIDQSDILFSEAPALGTYNAVGAGPGIGCRTNSHEGIKNLLERCDGPLVLDADAINILGEHRDWLEKLPEGAILTPHPREFERITEATADSLHRLALQKEFAVGHRVVVVVKGAHTATAFPDGTVFFNSTGNPGMATAGSGDVLTGIILSFLAQGYTSEEAALLGVFIHGLAGDMGAAERSREALIAGDIIEYMGNAFNLLNHEKRDS